MAQAGQPSEPPMKGFSPGRGHRPVARSARPILRKPVDASKERASPADAFCPQAPCPRATTQASRKCQTLLVPRQSRGFTRMKLKALCTIQASAWNPGICRPDDKGETQAEDPRG